jgi:hypothetical protein
VKGREISWTQAYEGRMRRFNLEVLLVALIALALLITWLFSTWEAFQKSLMMFPVVQLLPLTGVFTARIFLTRTALLAALLGRRCGFYLGPSFLGKPRAYKSSRFPTLLLQHDAGAAMGIQTRCSPSSSATIRRAKLNRR